MILVSRCLLGESCRYDGKTLGGEPVRPDGPYIAVCPECDGGLVSPRAPAEISGGDGSDVIAGRARVVDSEGRDVTAQFLKGARISAKKALDAGVKRAVLKSRSPSCGSGEIYDGSFSGRLRKGSGVFAQMLIDKGIKVEARD